MIKILGFCICLMFFISGCEKTSFEPLELTGRIVDTAGILSENEKQEIESAIINFENNTNGNFIICIVPELNGENIVSASHKVSKKWRKNQENIIILFIAMKENAFMIEIGSDFKQIYNNEPHFNNYVEMQFQRYKIHKGIISVINQSSNIITGKVIYSNEQNKNKTKIYNVLSLILLVIIVIIVLILISENDPTIHKNNERDN